jgi:hypothetical protein
MAATPRSMMVRDIPKQTLQKKKKKKKKKEK